MITAKTHAIKAVIAKKHMESPMANELGFHRNEMQRTFNCACGKEVVTTSRNKIRCDPCGVEFQKNYQREYRRAIARKKKAA